MSPGDGLADMRVLAIAEDASGRLWFGTYRGVSCYDGEGWTTYTGQDGLSIGLVYRALSEEGAYRRLTKEPLPCSATGSYVDETVWPGGAFWYELRILLDNGGETPAMGTRPYVSLPAGSVGSISYVAPNPSATGMTIGYSFPEHCRSASLSVYDVGGRLVRRLRLSNSGAAGVTATWDGTTSSGHRAASGVYLLRLEADGAPVSRKAVLLR